jgi:glycosyltransferase involved in cell wall biosynthesis
MRRFIRRGNQDVILSFLTSASLICELSALPNRNWKLIVGERNADPAILKSQKLRLIRFGHLLADFIVSNSQENLDMVHKANFLLSRNKGKVIYNFVDNKLKADNEHRSKNNLKTKIVVAARHEPQKNIEGVIKALKLLSEKEKDKLELTWYGGIETDESFIKANNMISVAKLSNVFHLMPKTLEITEIMKSADAVGLFSLYEGLPNVICEAMALGKPIICSRVSDLPKLITENVNGFLCNPIDPISIKNAIIKVIEATDNELFKMGQHNRIKSEQLFNKEEAVNSYLKLFSE